MNKTQLLEALNRKETDPVTFGNAIDLVLTAAEATREKASDDTNEMLSLIAELQSMVAELSSRVTALEAEQQP